VCIPPKGKGKGKDADGSKGKGKDKGKGKGKWALESDGARNVKAPSESGVASEVSSSAGAKHNAWERRRLVRSTDKPAPHAVDVDAMQSDPDGTQARELLEQMDTVQAMLNSLQGRSDAYSEATKATLTQELQSLRIKKTQMKSLDDQVTILENLVSRRTSILSDAELEMTAARNARDKAQDTLKEAEAQLAQVREAKAREDAARVSPQTADISAPEVTLSSARQMATLLPSDKAVIFAECLGLLSQMLEQHQETAAPVTMETQAAEAAWPQSATHGGYGDGLSSSHAHASSCAPRDPCGSQASQGVGKGAAVRDPYGSPRGRPRAMSVPASPQQPGRSRSNSRKRLRGKQPQPEGFALDHHFSRAPHQGTVPG